MTLGLSDSLSLTPATLLNIRVGYSSRPARSSRSMVWNDKQPARGEESKGLKVDLQSDVSVFHFLTMAYSSRTFYFCSTSSHSPL